MEETLVPTSVKDELHAMIDAMDDDTAIRTLAMISLLDDDGELSPEEEADLLEGIASLERGEVVDGNQLERELGLAT